MNKIIIYIIRDIDLINSKFEQILMSHYNWFSKEEKDYLNKYYFKIDLLKHTIGILLKKFMINQYMKTPISDIKIEYTESGKPYFDGLEDCFSISYTKNGIVGVISIFPIAIDIENIQSFIDIKDSDFFFPFQNNIKCCCLEWTKFESYHKLIGSGIGGFECNQIKYGSDVTFVSFKLSDSEDIEIASICFFKKDFDIFNHVKKYIKIYSCYSFLDSLSYNL